MLSPTLHLNECSLTISFFSENFGFGDPAIFEEAIGFIHSVIFTDTNINEIKIDHFLNIVKVNIPGPNDHGSYYGTIAFDSSLIIYESINLLKKKDIEKSLVAISTTAIDLIDCFIQVRDKINYDEMGFEEKILNHVVMQKEIAIQNGIISYLDMVVKVAPFDVETLMQLQENESNVLIIQD